jgi:hypothetical protein
VLAPAVVAVRGLGRAAESPAAAGEAAARLDLGYILRAVARDRCAVEVTMRDGAVLTGTIDRVGADHLDLAEHPLDAPRRDPAGSRVLAFNGMAAVRPNTT